MKTPQYVVFSNSVVTSSLQRQKGTGCYFYVKIKVSSTRRTGPLSRLTYYHLLIIHSQTEETTSAVIMFNIYEVMYAYGDMNIW